MYGYIYKTTNLLNGKFYIGKKAYYHNVKKKLTKKELSEIKTKGRKPVYKTVKVETDWKNYYGSSLKLKEDIEKYGKQNFKVEKLIECSNKKQLSYYETKYQFLYEVLETEDTYNDNILGKFYRKDAKL